MSLQPFTPDELAAWVLDVIGVEEPNEYQLQPGEFTTATLAESFNPPIEYEKARGMVRKLRYLKLLGSKQVRRSGRRCTVYWRLEKVEEGEK